MKALAIVDMSENLATLVTFLRNARKILIFTGAGISTSSGIPDFRGPEGVWTRRKPVYYDDFMGSEAARMEHWDYKMESWEVFRNAHPNAVHHATVKLERAGKLLAVLTQNIDGLHAKAGTSPHRLVELHGTNAVVECQSCHERTHPEPHFEYFREHRKAPRCNCGGFLKTATISFGQALHPNALQRANKATEETDLVVAMGSTLSVYPAASFPLQAAERGIPYVIVNRGVTDHDGGPYVSLRLEGEVSQIFPPAVELALLAS